MSRLFYFLSFICFLYSCSDEEVISDISSSEYPLTIYVENPHHQMRVVKTDTDDNNKEVQDLQLSFSQNDHATGFWINNNCSATALTYSEYQSCFCGYKVSSTSDEIVLLFPQQENYALSNGRLLLSMPHQDGTMKTVIDNCYQWGFAKLQETENGFSGTTVMSPLMSVFQFNFRYDGREIENIIDVSVKALKGGFYIDRYLNLSSGSWEEGNVIDSFLIHNIQPISGSFFVNVFPTSAEMCVTVTDASGNRYEGTINQQKFVGGYIYPLLISCDKISPTNLDTNEGFIDVCGTLWAKGNLIYDATIFGNNGYQEHFGIADNQWYFSELEYQDRYHISHFNWGVCGKNSTSMLLCAKFSGDLGAKLFTNTSCTQNTYSFDFAEYGDIAFWASNGKLRLPSKEDMYKLYTEASYCRGYYLAPNGEKIYGYLFWTPENNRETNTKPRLISNSELSSKLFLPDAGYRQNKSEERLQINKRGYYWHSENDGNMNQLMLTSSGILWRSTGAQFGRSVRPVKNETFVPNEDNKPYIEILSMKWAKGNLQYGSSKGTSDGFQDQWSLSETQWEFPDAGVGMGSHSSTQNPSAIYHFNWGVCGENALSQYMAATYNGDISGKMFIDQQCLYETNDFGLASFGDVAYWASNGQFRLPTGTEMYKLFTEASYSRGCYVDSYGNKTFGYLFKNPINGNREVISKLQTFTDYDLAHYLFLPCAGNRQAKSSEIYDIGSKGFYWHALKDNSFYQLTLGPTDMIWRTTNAKYGRTIRPLKNE